MKVFQDIISNDEMFTDIFPIELIDDVVYKVKGKLVTETTDTSNINIGQNASEEACDEEQADSATSTSGVNIVLANRLNCVGFDKKSYKVHIGDYMKSILKRLEEDGQKEEAAQFKKKISPFVKKVLEEFKEYDFYQGESMNPDAMCALLKWDEETPYMYFFKHGLLENKL